MNTSLRSATLFILFLLLWTTSAQAAFLGRLETAPGSGIFQAYYDDQLNITWTADANINGPDTWDNQVAWAASLDIDGVTGWRLPDMDVNNDGVIANCTLFTTSQTDCMDNEYTHLNYYGAGTVRQGGITVLDTGPFSNVQSGRYWSGTEFDIDRAWGAGFDGFGGQFYAGKTFFQYVTWAVHPGDVAVVPVPAAAWLFVSGLFGLIAIGKRKKTL